MPPADATEDGPVCALIVAAGRGARFGADVPKQYVDLAGRPVLARTLELFLGHREVDRVRVVIHADDAKLYASCVDAEAPGLLAPVAGGAERQDSVRLGLESLERDVPGCALVLIHDAARPFVSSATVSAVIRAAREHGGAVPAVAVSDTLKRAAGDGETVAATVPRDGLWRAQTPQGFRFAEILAAHRARAGERLTDDAAVAEAEGLAVRLVAGSADNVKLTTQDDLEAAAMTLTRTGETRVGSGFDVHRFEPGSAVVLCGVEIPHDAKLKGHSDADVGLHAICDAIYGAIGEGDIGRHFPPTEQRWRGAPSSVFLEHARGRVAALGGRIANVDVTVICEAPRIGPHADAMRAEIARILDIEPGRVNVKATTTERLGFTGRGEGIAAQAAASVVLPARAETP